MTGHANELHPEGIVNAQIQAADGVQMNSNHNPLLLSTTFTLGYTGTITAISTANMLTSACQAADFIDGNSSPACMASGVP